MNIFEVEPDHILEFYKRGDMYLKSTPKSASVKLLKLVLDETKTKVNIYIIRGSERIFVKQIFCRDDFKSISDKMLPDVKIKCHINYRGILIANFEKSNMVDISRTREMLNHEFR